MKSLFVFVCTFVLALMSTALFYPTPVLATEVVNHLGKKVTVVGQNKATARWEVINGAKSYQVYYKVCGENNLVGAIKVSDKTQVVDIGYLDPLKNYCYRVAGLVENKEVWLPEKTLQNASPPVLGATTAKKMPKDLRLHASSNNVLGETNALNNCFNCKSSSLTRETKWTEVKSHTGKMWKAPANPVTGNIDWTDLAIKHPNTKQFVVYYKECQSSNWQNAVVTPENSRNLSVQYLKPEVEYCYKVTTNLQNNSFSQEGKITPLP